MCSILTFSFFKNENNYVILIRYHDQNFSVYLMKETDMQLKNNQFNISISILFVNKKENIF